jgi:hypothetical protein
LTTEELAVASRQRTGLHFLFHQGTLFTKNSMTVVPHPPFFSLFPRLMIKMKGHHFDTIEVTGAESQAVLNILTEHYFQDTLKNGAGNNAYERMRVVSRPKFSF